MRQLALLLILPTITTLSADVRKWTSADGRVTEAELVGSRENIITLKLKDGREVPIELGKLSPADQAFVKAQGSGSVVGKNQPGFNDVVVDRRSWVMRPQVDTFGITAVMLTQQLETPHFLITTGPKIKPAVIDIYAEVCERLYSHMVRDLPGLAEKFTDRKVALWLTADDDEHGRMGQALENLGASGSSWTSSRISGVYLPRELAASKKISRSSRGFNTSYEFAAQRTLLWPQRINFTASTILNNYGHSFSKTGKRSFEMFNLSYCYFLENEITGKIESKVRFPESMTNVEGFKNPRGWAAAVKRILGDTPLKPSLRRFMSLDSSEAEPMDVGAGFGLMQFIFRDPTRKAAMNQLMENARKKSTPPDAEEFAKAMGCETPEAFDLKWIAFLNSGDFK